MLVKSIIDASTVSSKRRVKVPLLRSMSQLFRLGEVVSGVNEVAAAAVGSITFPLISLTTPVAPATPPNDKTVVEASRMSPGRALIEFRSDSEMRTLTTDVFVIVSSMTLSRGNEDTGLDPTSF